MTIERDYMFLSSEGDLYDTRKYAWAECPLRKRYAYYYSHITNGPQLLATLRAGEHVFPGGYRLFFLTSDGAALSFEAVKDNLYQVIYSIRNNVNDGWRVIGCDNAGLYDEEPLYCDHTGEQLNDVGDV